MYTTLKCSFILLFLLHIPISGITQSPISIKVDFDAGHSLRKDIYGVNNNLIRKPYFLSNESYQEIHSQLGKPNMRYPGGTVANYVNLATGWSEAWEGSNAKDSVRVNTHNNLLLKAGKEDGENIQEYINFLKSSGGNSTFVMNITSMNDAEAEQVLKEISPQEATIKYFELGNELYYKQYESAIVDADDYIEKAKNRTEIIKLYFPDAQVGILCPSSIWSKEVFLPDGEETGEREELWYEAIKKEDFYDALVLHMYSTIGMNRNVSMENWLPVEEAYTYGISQIDGKADEVFERLDEEFPGKKVWVTEYNIGGFSDSLSTYPLRGAYLSGLSTAGFFMKMLKNKNVEMSSWHSLVQMIENEESPFELLPQNTEFEKVQNFEFFKFFKQPIRQGRRYIPIQIMGNDDYQGIGEYNSRYSDINGFVSYNQETRKGYLVLINKKDIEYSIDVQSLESELGGQLVSIKSINPDSSQDLQLAVQANPTVFDLNEIDTKANSIQIQPYSIYKIQFDQSLTNIHAQEETQFKVYPNPSSNSIYIDGKDDASKWEILNVLGDVILTGYKKEINITHLIPEQYYIRIDGVTSVLSKI